jgi:hypothetical protein
MVSLCNMHYSTKDDMFRPHNWAIIRLLVEPMGRQYTTKNLMIYKAETCRCILHCNAYYIVIPSVNCCVFDCMYIHIVHSIIELTQRG